MQTTSLNDWIFKMKLATRRPARYSTTTKWLVGLTVFYFIAKTLSKS